MPVVGRNFGCSVKTADEGRRGKWAIDSGGITTDKIASDIVGRKLGMSELDRDGRVEEWTLEPGAFRQINIQQTIVTNTGLTLVIFMTTRNNLKPYAVQAHAAGKLELLYEWKAGQWVLAGVGNLTFRYMAGVPT